jgi:hypothetical protein
MPGGSSTVVVPGDKIDDVDGLGDALVDDKIDLRVLSRIENMVYQYQNPDGNNFPHPDVSGDEIGWPSYISNRTPRHMGSVSDIDSNSLDTGGVYIVNCTNQNKGLTITSGDGSDETLPVLSNVVIISPCDISFGRGSGVQNARIISLSGNDASFKAPHGLSLGSLGSDGCEANGAQLVTMGGMRFAADFSAYGSQMFSQTDIKFAATPGKPNDFKGVSMVAGGGIDMASHVNAQAGCDAAGAGEQITASYFRMVR